MSSLRQEQFLKILSWTIAMAFATVMIGQGKSGDYGVGALREALLGGVVGLALGMIFARNLNRSPK